MALKKTYTIEIQMDAARNALADATKKLADLDAQLEGLDKDSEAGKAIVAEMAKAAKQVEQLTNEVEGLGESLDNLKPGSIGALKQQAQDLEKALESALVGSAEADELIAELGRVKAQLKDIDEAVDVAFDKDRAGALADAASGLAGAFSLATVAAQNFGLTEEDADSYNQKLVEMLAVISSIEQVHKLTTSEVSTALKGLFGDAKKVVLGYLGIGQASTAAGTAATTSANVTRLALATLGIGLVLVVLTLVVTQWDRITAAVKRNKEAIANALVFIAPPLGLLLKGLNAIEKKFGSISAFAAGVGAAFKQAFSNLGDVLSGAEGQGRSVAEAFNKGVIERNNELLEERAREILKRRVAENESLLTVVKASGKDTAELEAKIFRERLASMKQETQEEKEEFRKLRAEYEAFKQEQIRKGIAEEQSVELAGLNARLARMQAAGQEALALQVQIKQKELSFLLAAPQRNNAAIIAKEGEILAIREAAKLELAKKEYEEFKKRVIATEKQELLTYQESQRRKAEQQLEQERRDAERLEALREELGKRQKPVQLPDAPLPKPKPIPLIDTFLAGVLGVKPEQLDEFKQVVGEALNSIYQSASALSQSIFDEAFKAVDRQIDDAQLRKQEIEQKLADSTSAAENAAKALDTAKGARREYLLGQIERERKQTEKLQVAKAKAAKDEEAAFKKRHQLEKESQRLSAATAVATNLATATEATYAAVKAVSGAAKLGFPASIPAMLAAFAAVAALVVSSRGLAKTFGDGGTLPGGIIKGGSHASGNDVPVFGGRVRVEGGEAITPVDATQKNAAALELIRTVGRTRTLLPEDFAQAASIRVLPSRYQASFGDGGTLPTASGATSAPAPDGMVRVKEADLSKLLAFTQQVAANTALIAGYGPAQLIIGEPEALKIEGVKQNGQQIQQANSL